MSLLPSSFRSLRRPGMTLLELLVATAITGTILVTIGIAMRTSVTTRSAVDRRLESLAKVRGVLDLVCDDLQQVHVYDSRAYLLVEKREVAGKTVTSIAFPSATPIRVSEEMRERPGLIEIAYLVGQDPNNEKALAVFRRELAIETDRSAVAIRSSDQGLVLLADGLTEFDMDFLPQPGEDEPANGRQAEYQDQWEGGFGVDKMPVAIRFRISADPQTDPQKALVFRRTVRLPTPDVNGEMLQPALNESLNVETEK
jgi:prepilin-type N-terminal cleavage/methylation domain-containing protein